MQPTGRAGWPDTLTRAFVRCDDFLTSPLIKCYECPETLRFLTRSRASTGIVLRPSGARRYVDTATGRRSGNALTAPGWLLGRVASSLCSRPDRSLLSFYSSDARSYGGASSQNPGIVALSSLSRKTPGATIRAGSEEGDLG